MLVQNSIMVFHCEMILYQQLEKNLHHGKSVVLGLYHTFILVETLYYTFSMVKL